MSKFSKTLLVAVLIFGGNLVYADLIDGEELRDPTRPIFTTGENNTEVQVLDMIRNVIPSSYDLSFVRASSTSPLAVINSERVSLGDVVGGATVVAIERSSVTLSIKGEERVISLYSNDVKTPVSQ